MRLIDADALIEKYTVVIRKTADEKLKTEIAVLLKDIEEQPTIDAEPVRHGKWIEYPTADGMNQCSVCGVLRFGESNYCPNCGARMEE